MLFNEVTPKNKKQKTKICTVTVKQKDTSLGLY